MVSLIGKSMIQENVLGLIRSFLNNHLKIRILTSPSPLIQLRRKAIRAQVWWRIEPLRRALIDAAIMFLRRGGAIRSHRLIILIREVLIEILTHILSRNLVFTAYLVGMELVRRFGRFLGAVRSVKYVIYLGIQWLNTPLIFRGGW